MTPGCRSDPPSPPWGFWSPLLPGRVGEQCCPGGQQLRETDTWLLFLRSPSRRPSRWRRACCGDPTESCPSLLVRPSEPVWVWGGSGSPQRALTACPVPADAPLLARGGRTGRGLARLRLLETYIRELLAAEERVSQSPALVGFFAPQPLDLEPTLPPGRCLPQLPAPRGGPRKGRAESSWVDSWAPLHLPYLAPLLWLPPQPGHTAGP